jgi:hypothetical protein
MTSKPFDEDDDPRSEREELLNNPAPFKKRSWLRAIGKIMLIALFGFGCYLYGQHKRFPIPVFDPGHDLFMTKDEAACALIVSISADNGLSASAAFDAVPTHQVIMGDQTTVYAWPDADLVDGDKPAKSYAVSDPRGNAEKAAERLKAAHYSAEIDEPIKDLAPGLLVRLRTNALLNGCLVFRKPAFRGMPQPTWRKIPTVQ